MPSVCDLRALSLALWSITVIFHQQRDGMIALLTTLLPLSVDSSLNIHEQFLLAANKTSLVEAVETTVAYSNAPWPRHYLGL